MREITLTRPDDWHLHVRSGLALRSVVPHSARQFARAIIMPNLKPPITTVAGALAYRKEVLSAVPEASHFSPLMTLYLTESTPVAEVQRVGETDGVLAFKLYPAGATTHSDAGVARIEAIYPLLEAMLERNVPLLVHGEVTDADIDIFDREKVFIDRHLREIVDRFPGLRLVLEHVTTREGVQFVESAPPTVAATLTPQHLMYNRNALLAGAIRPHYYCLPVLKRETHRKALVAAATGGSPKFFLGTDSAPHPRQLKESSCGCAGCFSAHAALEFYAQVFEENDALDKLEGFASFHGADFYGISRNSTTVTLRKAPWTVPDTYPLGEDLIVPLGAGITLDWQQGDIRP